MKTIESAKKYFDLTIEASSQDTDIWLAGDDGHLVQKETGVLRTSVLPGQYVVDFKLGGQTYPISLDQNLRFTESQIRAGPTCPRPEVVLLDDDWPEKD